MAASDIKVALVGDSVLDNHYWLLDPTHDVREQTERTLKILHPSQNVQVFNFAVDESMVNCILRGRAPRSQFQVLSVGGNDARIRFLQSRNPDVITQLMVADGLVANLRRVIEIIHAEVTPNIILVYVFMPQFKTFPLLSLLPPASVLQHLLVNFSEFFIELAQEYNLPIIDLSRTFNPNEREHYGSTPIEPSNKSGQFIADLISKVIEDFRFQEEASAKIFSGIGADIRVQDLSPHAGFSYEEELRTFLLRKATKKSSCVIG